MSASTVYQPFTFLDYLPCNSSEMALIKQDQHLHPLTPGSQNLPLPSFTKTMGLQCESVAHHCMWYGQQTPCCASCPQVVTAMGRTWHPEHFVCTHCLEEIGSRNFFERDGQPYCEKDYHNLFSPRCHYCNGPILDVSILHTVTHYIQKVNTRLTLTKQVPSHWSTSFFLSSVSALIFIDFCCEILFENMLD